ncbi:uncharacterized protein [Macrobrachium rosenbergii]|uniref:uncharacterized protein n=1 Tax=Macrobrachium rosenbergii TaxID=79674 RepID=UPI0034D4B783
MKRKHETLISDTNRKLRTLKCGQRVQALSFARGSPKWENGVIVGQTGPVSYTVRVGEKVWRRHIDQLVAVPEFQYSDGSITNDPCLSSEERYENKFSDYCLEEQSPLGESVTEDLSKSSSDSSSKGGGEPLSVTLDDHVTLTQNSTSERRYPLRERRPPDRLTYS